MGRGAAYRASLRGAVHLVWSRSDNEKMLSRVRFFFGHEKALRPISSAAARRRSLELHRAARRCSCSAHLVISRLIKAEQHLARRRLLSGASYRVRILTRGRVLGGAAGLPGGDVGRVGGEGEGHHGRVVLREEVLPIAQVCSVHTQDTTGVQRVYSGRSLVAPAP